MPSDTTSPPASLIRPLAHTQASRRPLIVRFGAMGDMVMMTTLVRALASRFRTPVDILSSGAWTRPLLLNQPGVGEIHLLTARKLPYFLSRHQQTLVEALALRGAGPVWYCDTDNRCLPLLARAGFDADLVCAAGSLPMLPDEHLTDYWLRFARVSPAAGYGEGLEDIVDEQPTLTVPTQDLDALDRWLAERGLCGRELILVQAGNKRTMRRGLRRRPSNTKWWPEARWAAVIQALSEAHPQAAILLLGVPQEHQLNEEIMALSRRRNLFNLARDLPIPRLLALQARAVGMVSVDTGPAHAAAALGCPVVVLFGAADPVRIAPRGAAPVRHLTGADAKGPSILGITVDQVIDAWTDLPKRERAPFPPAAVLLPGAVTA